MTKKIILISELIDQRIRKENEIEFYEKQLQEINNKLLLLRKEKDLTEVILRVLENEKIIDISEEIKRLND